MTPQGAISAENVPGLEDFICDMRDILSQTAFRPKAGQSQTILRDPNKLLKWWRPARSETKGTAMKKMIQESTDGDSSTYMTPCELASRWHWHPESIRRALRGRRLASVIIGRRRLIPISEVRRLETEGLVARSI
jgi:hypothetical protein